MAVISLERYTILSLGVWFYVLYHTIQSEKQFYHICVSLVTDRYNQLVWPTCFLPCFSPH